MKLVLSAGSLFTLPLEQIFLLARQTGYDGVEVIINQEFRFHDGGELIRQLQQIHPICSLHAPFFPIDGWGDQIQQLQRTIHLALETGIPLITFHPPVWLGLGQKFWRWLQTIADFQAELGRHRVRIALENMPANGPLGINTYRLAKTGSLIAFLDRHNLDLTFDTAHMGSTRADFLGDFHRLYDTGRMRNIHFSDFVNGREHLLPGHGMLPLTRFLNHLRETGYDQSLVLELTPGEFPDSMEGIRASLAELFAYLAAETGRPAARGGTGQVREDRSLPRSADNIHRAARLQ